MDGNSFSDLTSMLLLSLIFTCLLLATSVSQETRFASEYANLYLGPYKHIYPPVDITQDPDTCTPSSKSRCPLYIAIMFSFGGAFTSSGVIPGVQLAIDQMNNDSSFLPGYKLHLLLHDSQVSNTHRKAYKLIVSQCNEQLRDSLV